MLNRSARTSSDAICALVTGADGQYRAGALEQPALMPVAASASMAAAWVLAAVSAAEPPAVSREHPCGGWLPKT